MSPEKTIIPEDGPRYGASSMKRQIIVVLTRPLRMFAEPLVFFTDLFLLYQYTILFLYFEAYPIIFKGSSALNTLFAYVSY